VATAAFRSRPLIAVLSGVPLFLEAMTAAFEGIADVASISADDQHARGLLRAYDPNAAIIEGCEPGIVRGLCGEVADPIDRHRPAVS